MNELIPSSDRWPTRAALAVGAGCLWLGWWLMPDAATNDAIHILDAVGGARDAVHLSAAVHLLGSALAAIGLADEAARRTRTWHAGALLLLAGLVGMGADAVYHQLAYEMTAPGIDRAAVTPVMTGMQTRELRTLAPLLLAFVAGAPLFGAELRATRRRPGPAAWLLLSPLPTLPLAIVAVRAAGLPRRFVALAVLGEICGGLIACALARRDRATG
jgi:hypothetical protein